MAVYVKAVLYGVFLCGGFSLALGRPGPLMDRAECKTCSEVQADSNRLLPKPGDHLNYTQIMFDHPQVPGATEYVLEVFEDAGDAALNKPLVKRKSASPAVMLGNFEFDKKYIWRYAAYVNGNSSTWEGPYRFEILPNPYSDENTFRVHVVQSTPGQFQGLISIDYAGYIVDNTGRIVWFLPPLPGTEGAAASDNFRPFPGISDLRFTPSGTVTFISTSEAIEWDLNGKRLWEAPLHGGDASAPVTRNFNHCFAKLHNGHYMAISSESFPFHPAGVPADKDTSKPLLVPDEVIDEFDADGNLVWKFSSNSYFDPAGFAAVLKGELGKRWVDTRHSGHFNGFDVDEKNGFIYASYRNDDLVVKIDKNTGRVIYAWNGKAGSACGDTGALFARQHAPGLMSDGSLALFSNNTTPEEWKTQKNLPAPEVVILNQSAPAQGISGSGSVTFRFNCQFDTVVQPSIRGGNVFELPDGHMLVCMGEANRIFETDRNKNIFWNALVERRAPNSNAWSAFPLYKTSYTSSLYPCYFSLQTRCANTKGKDRSLQLLVFNDGTEADSYRINISSASADYNKQFQTQSVAAGASLSFELLPDAALPPDAKIDVIVTSVTNPAFSRVLCVP